MGILFAGNISLNFTLVTFLWAFKNMAKAGYPWSRLVISQLINDNVLTFLALLYYTFMPSITEYDRICTSRLVFRTASFFGGITLTSGTLAGRIMMLCSVLDRIQAFWRPAEYMAHDRKRRAVMVNVLSYAGGFLLSLAILLLPIIWAGDFGNYDLICCFSNQKSRTFVETYNQTGCITRAPANLNPLCHDNYGNQSVLLTFVSLAFTDTLVMIGSIILTKLYWRHLKGRIAAGMKNQTAEEKSQERAVTVTILLDAASLLFVTVASLLVQFDGINMFVPAILFAIQVTLCAYTIPVLASKEFRRFLCDTPFNRWIPNVNLIKVLCVHYTLHGVIAIIVVYVFVHL